MNELSVQILNRKLMHRWILLAEKWWLHIWKTKPYHFKIFDWLVLMLQDTETETLKPHYIHVYKVFG